MDFKQKEDPGCFPADDRQFVTVDGMQVDKEGLVNSDKILQVVYIVYVVTIHL